MPDPGFGFDTPLDIRGVWSSKWDYAGFKTGAPDAFPLWVADMDFETVPAAKAAVLERAKLGVYGYTDVDPVYREAVRAWLGRRQGWDVPDAWMVHTPGVICAVHTAVRAFSSPGDPVLIQPPVYHPFYRVLRYTRRAVLENPLIDTGESYEVDWDDFELKLRTGRPKIFILCHPHNPTGKVYTAQELARFGELCGRYGTVVVSDEIHGDLVGPGTVFTPFALAGGPAAAKSVICTAPSKTFNLAGLHLSNIFIPDPDMRERFTDAFNEAGIPSPNIFSAAAANAAYREGDAWLDAVREYLWDNRRLAEDFISKRVPGAVAYRSEGTYFLWLDCRAWKLDDSALEKFMLHEAGLWVNQGAAFGAQGSGFVRLNLALPQIQLAQALSGLEKAASGL